LKTLYKVTFLTSNEWRNETNFEACGHKTYLIKEVCSDVPKQAPQPEIGCMSQNDFPYCNQAYTARYVKGIYPTFNTELRREFKSQLACSVVCWRLLKQEESAVCSVSALN